MKTLSLIIILISLIPAYGKGFKNCHYYLDLEKDRGCWFNENDTSDYLVRYGYKYCSTFENKSKIWNKDKTDWAISTRNCLQAYVKSNQKSLTCEKLESKAFDSHPKCYKDAGFCKLGASNQVSIIWTAVDLDIFRKFDKSIKQAFYLLKDCIKISLLKLFSLQTTVKNIAQNKPLLISQLNQILDINKVPDSFIEKYIDFAQMKLISMERKNVKPNEVSAYQDAIGSRFSLAKARTDNIDDCFKSVSGVKACNF